MKTLRMSRCSRFCFVLALAVVSYSASAAITLTAQDARVFEGGTGPHQVTFNVATSGTSVHRWTVAGRPSHHLIDPRTGRPARTDLVQATVLARSAREAEAIAKTAVIVGSEAALERLDRRGVHAAILLTERGEVLLTPSTLGWLS